MEIKINRKTYHITAVKANIKAPLLGWDFYKKYKLDMVWDEDKDEVYLYDKKAQIRKKLDMVTVPHGFVPRFSAVETSPSSSSSQSIFLRFGAQCVAALEVKEEKEVHTEEYLKMVDKYKEILNPL